MDGSGDVEGDGSTDAEPAGSGAAEEAPPPGMPVPTTNPATTNNATKVAAIPARGWMLMAPPGVDVRRQRIGGPRYFRYPVPPPRRGLL